MAVLAIMDILFTLVCDRFKSSLIFNLMDL